MSRLSRVVPAILTDDPEALETMVRQAESFTSYVQIDIMDGRFVPSRSIGWQELVALSPKLEWEAHLMVERPQKYLEGFRKAGAGKVVFHYEATPSPMEIISLVRDIGLKVGLAVNPETPLKSILPLADKVDSVLFLTVNPGFYGSPFLPEVLDKVAEFGNACPEVEIGVDGGIKESNIAQIARVGIDAICVGSAVFMQPDPGKSFRRLQSLARSSLHQR